jgi:hypothetical protein
VALKIVGEIRQHHVLIAAEQQLGHQIGIVFAVGKAPAERVIMLWMTGFASLTALGS